MAARKAVIMSKSQASAWENPKLLSSLGEALYDTVMFLAQRIEYPITIIRIDQINV